MNFKSRWKRARPLSQQQALSARTMAGSKGFGPGDKPWRKQTRSGRTMAGLAALLLASGLCSTVATGYASVHPVAVGAEPAAQPISARLWVSAATSERLIRILDEAFWRQMGQGCVAETIALQRRILALSEANYGTDDPRVSGSMATLASLYMDCNCPSEAGPLYEQSLAIEERIQETDHLRIAVNLENLAVWALATGRNAQAESLLLRSLKIRREVHDLEDETVVDTWMLLAQLYLLPGESRHAEAVGVLLPALQIASRERLYHQLWQVQAALSQVYAGVAPKVAVYWGWQAVDTIGRRRPPVFPQTAQMLQEDLERTGRVYTTLSQQLVVLDRRDEAAHVLGLMKARENEGAISGVNGSAAISCRGA